MLYFFTYFLFLALLCRRSLAFQIRCSDAVSGRPRIKACAVALQKIDNTVDQHWQRTAPVLWVPRHYSNVKGFPTCGQQWSSGMRTLHLVLEGPEIVDLTISAEGCSITLHCSMASRLTLRDVHMLASDAVKHCVSPNLLHSHGATASWMKGTSLEWLALLPAKPLRSVVSY